jgi:hypothetical protein
MKNKITQAKKSKLMLFFKEELIRLLDNWEYLGGCIEGHVLKIIIVNPIICPSINQTY